MLRLFVWHGVLIDYSSGIMFALAETQEHAEQMILAQAYGKVHRAILPEFSMKILRDELRRVVPIVFDNPVAYIIGGGA